VPAPEPFCLGSPAKDFVAGCQRSLSSWQPFAVKAAHDASHIKAVRAKLTLYIREILDAGGNAVVAHAPREFHQRTIMG
jgi:hypothetical protein